MDSKHREAIGAIAPAAEERIFCPDHMLGPVQEAFPGCDAVPYCNAADLSVAPPEWAIVHKGLLPRIGRSALVGIILRSEAFFANDVFVVYRHAGEWQRTRPADPGTSLHVAPVLEFCRRWQPWSRGRTSNRAVVCSAWKVGNVGDDAVTLAAAGICRRLGFEEVVFTGPGGSLEPIEGAGLVVVGGGGLLYDKDVPNVGNYTAPLRFAAECGVPAAVLGVGTQGIRTAIGRAAYRHALPLAALATVRDVTDAEVLDRECGLAGIQVTADLAFVLPELDPAWRPQRRRSGAKPIALLSVGKHLDLVSGQEGYALQTTIALVEALRGTHEVILAQHSVDDEEICAGAEAATGARRLKLAELGVRATLDAYASADLAVTSRYHGVVFAALAGIPVAPVCSREDKIGRLITHALPSLDRAASKVSEGTAPPLVAEEIVRRAVPAARDEVDAIRAAAARNIGLLTAAIRDPSAALRPNARPREAALGRSAIHGWVPPECVAAPSQPRPGKLSSSSQASPSDRAPLQGQAAEQSPQPRQKRQRSQAGPLPGVVRDLCGEGVFLDVRLPTTGADVSQPVQPCVGHVPVVSLDLHPQDDGLAGSIALSINGSTSAELEPLPSGAHPLDAATDWMQSKGLPPVSFVRLVDPDPNLLLRTIKHFSGATILVDGWDAICPTEEDVKTLSVHLALKDIGLFELRGEELLPVPIFSVGECGSSIVVVRPLAQMPSSRMSEQ